MGATAMVSPLIPALLVGLAVTLAAGPCLRIWDALALRQVGDCVTLGRTVGISVETIRLWMRWWGATMVAAPFLIVGVFGSPVLVPIALGLIYATPRWVLGTIIRGHRDRLRDQLVPVCFSLANAVRAGLSPLQGLKLAGTEAPEPLRSELFKVVQDNLHGRTLPQALADASNRLDLNGFRLLAMTLISAHEHGGPVTETLDGLASAVQEGQRLQLKMDTETAGGRLSLWLMGFFPLAFLLANYLIEPTSTSLFFSTLTGQGLLTAVILLIVISVRLGLRITKIEHAV